MRRPLLETGSGSHAEAFGVREWGLLAGVALIWGSSYLFIDVGLEALAPGVIAVTRVVLGLAALALVPASASADRARGPRPGGLPRGDLDRAADDPVPGGPAVDRLLGGRHAEQGRAPGRRRLGGGAVAPARSPPPRGRPADPGSPGSWPSPGPSSRGRGLPPWGRPSSSSRSSSTGWPSAWPCPCSSATAPSRCCCDQVAALVLLLPFGVWGLRDSSFAWPSVLAMVPLEVLGTGVAFVLAATGRPGRPGPAGRGSGHPPSRWWRSSSGCSCSASASPSPWPAPPWSWAAPG